MSEVTEAPTQDAIAESLMGDQTEQVSAEQPQVGAEAVEQPEQFESQETEQQTEQEQLEDWLPSDQDKVFPNEVYARYGQRYGFSPEQVADPLIQQLLHDKINSDIFIQQQREAEQQQEFQLEEPQQEPTQQQFQQPVTLEQHMSHLNQWAQGNTDPRVADMVAKDLLGGLAKYAENPTTQTAQALTNSLATFGLNLMQTAIPQMLAPMLESIMPGMSGMYYQSARGQAWDSVRNSDPKYGDMPAYGTKEFVALCQEVAAANPRLTAIGLQLQAANGGELYGPRAEQFYGMLADLASRPKADPEQLLQAAAAGAQRARRADVMRQAGNLGAGQSKGPMNRGTPKSQFQTNQDIFDEDAMEMYRKQHGSL